MNSVEEKFDVVLENFSKDLPSSLRSIVDITGLLMEDARIIAETLPYTIKQGLHKQEADAIKKKFEEKGFDVSIQPSKTKFEAALKNKPKTEDLVKFYAGFIGFLAIVLIISYFILKIFVGHSEKSAQQIQQKETYSSWASKTKDYWNRVGSGKVLDVGIDMAPTSIFVQVEGYNAAQAEELARYIYTNFKKDFPDKRPVIHVAYGLKEIGRYPPKQ